MIIVLVRFPLTLFSFSVASPKEPTRKNQKIQDIYTDSENDLQHHSPHRAPHVDEPSTHCLKEQSRGRSPNRNKKRDLSSSSSSPEERHRRTRRRYRRSHSKETYDRMYSSRYPSPYQERYYYRDHYYPEYYIPRPLKSRKYQTHYEQEDVLSQEEEYAPQQNTDAEIEAQFSSPEDHTTSLRSTVVTPSIPMEQTVNASLQPVLPNSGTFQTEGVVEGTCPQISSENLEANAPSSPEVDPLEVVYYPPDGAQAHFNGINNTVYFIWRQAHYGDFPIITTNPLSFKLGHELLRDTCAIFISDCYTNPSSRPNSSKASDDLMMGQQIFNQKLKDGLGFSISLTPPGTQLHKKHALSEDIHKALNKCRVDRTSEASLRKILKGIEPQEPMKRLSAQAGRPLFPKVASFMTVTADEDIDRIISFLNQGTSTSKNYVSATPFSDLYVTTPSVKTLALQHHLKQELLFHLGLYNHLASTFYSITNIKSSLHESANDQISRLELTGRWTAYGYKSLAKIVILTAEKLGAVCLLLRCEAASHQTTPQLGRELIYEGDIVGPTLINDTALKRLESAPAGLIKTINPTTSKTKLSAKNFQVRQEGINTLHSFAKPRNQPSGYNPSNRQHPKPSTSAPAVPSVKRYQSFRPNKSFRDQPQQSHRRKATTSSMQAAGERKKTRPTKPLGKQLTQ